MSLTRRELCVLLPALLAATTVHSADKTENKNVLLQSGFYDYKNLPVYKDAGDSYIPVFEGNTHAGVHIKLHETDLAPGAVAHPPHHHAGEEIFMVRDGELEVEIDGKPTQLMPGSVAYVASNAEHAIRNTSKEPARYFVLLLGSPLP